MDPITIALGLATFFAPKVPALVGRLAGPKAEAVAKDIIGIAEQITGTADPAKQRQILQANPDLVAQLADAASKRESDYKLAELKVIADNEETTQETYRQELKSEHPYVWAMRPTFGYILALTLLLEAISVLYCVFEAPEALTSLATVLSSLSMVQSVALAVLGIYVKGRTDEKAIEQTGALAPGLMNSIGARIAGTSLPSTK